jgi:DUF917 family protein
VRSLTRDEVWDVVLGMAAMGSGGGGSMSIALESLGRTIADGETLCLVDLEELAANACVASVGGIGPVDPSIGRAEAAQPQAEANPSASALRALCEHAGVTLGAVMTSELGAEALAEAWVAAAALGLPLVDADPVGRAVPKMQMTLFNLAGVPPTPQAVVTEFGDELIVTNVASEERLEAMLRALACVSGRLVFAAHHLTTVADLRDAVVSHAVSGCERIGRALREARERGQDPAAAVASAGGGEVRFRGTLASATSEEQAGFTVGETHLVGSGSDASHEYRIWLKNENLIAWRNGVPDVTTPDLITLVDERGEILLNPCSDGVGREVAVVALPAPSAWCRVDGLALLGPRSFGFDIDYVPKLGAVPESSPMW